MRAVYLAVMACIPAAALVPAVALTACGSGDDGASSDAAAAVDAEVAVDAPIPDAGTPDAFDPCPGETTFEIGVVDWTTGENLPGVIVEESEGNGASSAPNGRVVVCVPATGLVNFRFSKTDYVDRIHTTTVEAIAAQYASGVAPSFRMLTESDADSLYTGIMSTRDVGRTTFIAMPTNANTGEPLAGATVSIDAANDGSYVPQGAGLVLGDESLTDGKVVMLNTDLGKANTTEIVVTGPGSCEIPSAISLEAGVSSVALPCQP